MTRALVPCLAISVLLGCGGGTSGTSGGGGTTGGTGGHPGTSSVSATASSTGTGGPHCTTDPDCAPGLSCCGDVCVNLRNDIFNCSKCGKKCLGEHPICSQNTCADAPCNSANTCDGGGFCCDTMCCAAGMLCCEVQKGGPSTGPACTAPELGTCPVGCPLCN